MMEGTVFTESEQFNVWAFYNPAIPSTTNNNIDAWVAEYKANASKGAKVYVDEKPFEYHTEYSKWAGVTPYFWPKVGTLAFAGYYPTTLENKVAYTLEPGVNAMTFTDIKRSWVTSEASNSEDVMYFNLTQSYVGTTAPVVTAIFKHALSWLTVNLSTDAQTDKLGANITVRSVKFTNVRPEGDAVVDNQSRIEWTPKGTPVAVDVVTSPVVLTTGQQEQREPLFIPQTMAGNLEITYTVSSPKDADGHVSSFTETKVVALNTLKGWVPTYDAEGNLITDKDGNPVLKEVGLLSEWEDAKHYIYNIVISTSEILIDASVQPWDEVIVPVEVK
jgi:hypothetical protein